uniref:Putative secreted peptide n=1 Tax=Anopheles braziliensis TaxID=58242 RepID=A0A2M3ZRL2_9DIPT
MQRLLRRSQMRSVLSSLAVIMYLPPGWNTIPRTQLSWPASVNRHRPELTSQTLIILSRDPDARKGP